MMTFSFSQFSRLATILSLGAFVLTACAVEGEEPAPSEDIASKSDALINNGGGPGLGFNCDSTRGTCECSKSIEGDCDRMRKYCTGGLDGLDTCLKGWLTTDCTCTFAQRTVPRVPIYTVPRGGVLTTF